MASSLATLVVLTAQGGKQQVVLRRSCPPPSSPLLCRVSLFGLSSSPCPRDEEVTGALTSDGTRIPDAGLVHGGELDLGFFDPTAGGSHRRRAARRECVRRAVTGDLVKAKSGEAVPVTGSADRQRSSSKRHAIRRLSDGQIVNAKVV